MKQVYIYRIRKNIGNKLAPGIGLKIAKEFGNGEDNVLTSLKPRYKIKDNSIILCYGNSKHPEWYDDAIQRGCIIINHPDKIKNSIDKIKSFDLFNLHEVNTLEHTTSKEVACAWIEEGCKVIIRSTTTGKQGQGIIFATNLDELIDAPLYTKFYDKTTEFRVHVLNGKVIDYVQKKKMSSKTLEERGITLDLISRNHKKGWVFAHNDIIYDNKVANLGIEATKAVGLDLAGVDILAKVENNKVIDCRVCEINSSPGMSSSTTFNKYINSLKELVNN